MAQKNSPRGQVLVMFTLFLLVLLGISALAIDYASWLLTDRALQNYSDHAALAGADVFDDRPNQGDCQVGTGITQCTNARAQAWASLNNELDLGMSPTIISCMATFGGLDGGNSPVAGETDSSRASGGACTAEAVVDFKGHKIWVSTPPPDADRYENFGGRFSMNFGVVWVRVDRPVQSFLGGAFGIKPDPRTGWATAGALPTDFALQIFCRNQIAPQGGVCKSDSLSLNGAGTGAGGIWLVRGDIGSNESLKLTAQGNAGVVLQSGNMFLVNEVCASSTWNCPVSPATGGGIADANPLLPGNTANMKNAFYIPPQPVPQFASPVNANTVSDDQCVNADATHLCIPWRDQTSSTPNAPGSWTCVTSGAVNRCGVPTVTLGSGSTPGSVTCAGVNGGVPGLHYYPTGISNGSVSSSPSQNPGSSRWQKISPLDNPSTILDDYVSSGNDTLATPPATADDFVFTGDLNVTGGTPTPTTSFTVTLGSAGNRVGGVSTVRYTAFKVDGGVPDNTQNPVTLQVTLVNGAGTTIAVDPQVRTLTNVPQRWEFTVGAGLIANYNSLQLRFTFTSSGDSEAANERGGAISWAGIEHPDPQPASPPFIPPGYYKSIDIPNGGCAVLDPTAETFGPDGLKDFQMPGIYRFGGSGNDRKVKMGNGAWLIGDGVTFVFDSDWPDSGSGRGLTIDADGGLALNMMRDPTTAAPCAAQLIAPDALNYSSPLGMLLYGGGVCGAWGVDTTVQVGVRPGYNAWHHCDPANRDSAPHCVGRNSYLPASPYRGITFYFTPDPGWGTAHASMNIRNRFEMQGGVGNLAYRGVNYAPYDDVSIQGQAGFNTAGQVLAWTAKFHGGGAFIYLDYPYEFSPAAPYLLEPTIDH